LSNCPLGNTPQKSSATFASSAFSGFKVLFFLRFFSALLRLCGGFPAVLPAI
jgi:hypothetical protein